jgi:hypothetical protein
MKRSTMMTSAMPRAPMGKAWEEVSASGLCDCPKGTFHGVESGG